MREDELRAELIEFVNWAPDHLMADPEHYVEEYIKQLYEGA